MSRKSAALVLNVWLFSSLAWAQPDRGPEKERPMPGGIEDVVVVTGNYAGPPLWKISHGEHVLHIFALPGVVPARMEWDNTLMRRALGRSQQYLPMLDKSLPGIPSEALMLPEGSTLQTIVPPADYERYLTLKARYFPRSDRLELLHPLIAGSSLLGGIYERAGLASGNDIHKQINRLARRQRKLDVIKVAAVRARIDRAESNAQLVVDLDNAGIAYGNACFAAALTRVEENVRLLQRQANAWAESNMAELRTLAGQNLETAECKIHYSASEGTETAMSRALLAAAEDWRNAAEQALLDNESTVAVATLAELLGPTLIEYFQDRGYVVEEPD